MMKTIWRIQAVVVSILVPAMTALAQDRYGRGGPAEDKPEILWAPWLFTVVFLAAIAVLAFKNARRTHLD